MEPAKSSLEETAQEPQDLEILFKTFTTTNQHSKSNAQWAIVLLHKSFMQWIPRSNDGKCKIVRDHSKVNDKIADFNLFANDILDNKFAVCILLAFKHIDNIETNTSVIVAPGGAQGGGGKAKAVMKTSKQE